MLPNLKWRPFAALLALSALCALSGESLAQTAEPQADLDVSWKAKAEIARRGPMVERVNGFAADSDQALLV
jgi:hypothetical protein